MKNILVTGAAGYLGTAVCDLLLQAGHRIRGLDNFTRNDSRGVFGFTRHPNFEFVYGDITNTNDVQKAANNVHAVIWLAAVVGEPACKRHNDLCWAVNLRSVQELCQNLSSDIPILFASTGSVYGSVDGTCTENSPVSPLSGYAKSKWYAEDEVLDRGNAVVFRKATAMGLTPNYRQDLLVNDLTYRAATEKAVVLFEPDFMRSFCHAYDLASAYVFALDHFKEMDGQIYNVGHNDNNWTKRRLAEYLQQKTGCEIFYGQNGYSDPDKRSYYFDVSKINGTGWAAKITVEQTVDELLKAVPALKGGYFKDKL